MTSDRAQEIIKNKGNVKRSMYMILTEANKRNGEEERNRPIHCSGMPIMNE
jgi:hypothetical protein